MQNKIIYVKLFYMEDIMTAMHNISYGIYVLTTKTDKYNGCIINTLMQVTSSPNQISITINKDNHTTKMIQQSGVFNVSVLDETTPFDLIKTFGFASGKDVDKFATFKDFALAENGIPYITKHTNSYLSANVISSVDLGTHITFFAEVSADVVLSKTKSATYAFYHSNIKPKSQPQSKGVFVCKICGYVYEGYPLPEDFVCPICKHGAQDFVWQEAQTEEKQTLKTYYCPTCGYEMQAEEKPESCPMCGMDMIEK